MSEPLTLEWLAGRYAVCRMKPGAPIPSWGLEALQQAGPSSARTVAVQHGHKRGEDPPARLTCVTRTERELSIVIDESLLTAGATEGDSPESRSDPALAIQRGFIALRIAGTLDFALVGVIAQLTAALADANVSVFVISTYDTDIILVREADRQRAIEALREVANFASVQSPT